MRRECSRERVEGCLRRHYSLRGCLSPTSQPPYFFGPDASRYGTCPEQFLRDCFRMTLSTLWDLPMEERKALSRRNPIAGSDLPKSESPYFGETIWGWTGLHLRWRMESSSEPFWRNKLLSSIDLFSVEDNSLKNYLGIQAASILVIQTASWWFYMKKWIEKEEYCCVTGSFAFEKIDFDFWLNIAH